MIALPLARVGPYVRALAAGLDALAPHDDHVPLAEARAHLEALDPALSGDLLLPAEVSVHTGMPAFAWMERARSEQAVAAARPGGDEPSDADLARAEALDPALGRRMRDRRALHRHLRRSTLLPVTRIGAAARRLHRAGRSAEVTVRYDRLAPDGRWLRIRFDLRTSSLGRGAPLVVDDDGRVTVDAPLQHLVTRHFATPLLALRGQLADATGGELLRLSRAWIGPFWFPGVALPDGAPAALGGGLLLHVSQELVAADVSEARHLDPLLPPPDHEAPPDGQRIFRERRFAASPNVLPVVRDWLDRAGIRAVVAPLGAAPRRSL